MYKVARKLLPFLSAAASLNGLSESTECFAFAIRSRCIDARRANERKNSVPDESRSLNITN